jgi:2-polyprenyl-3-methyl-5-hydroxy-6-metoxy-1,4-benzoquinol methylase
LFLKNNERIDFSELEQRVTLELGRLDRAATLLPERTSTWTPDSSGLPGRAAAPMIGESEMQSEAAPHRSIGRMLSHLAWGILHLPGVLRRAISAVFAAEFARTMVDHLKQSDDAIQSRIAAAERSIAALRENDDPRDLVGEIARLRRGITARLDELEQARHTSDGTANRLRGEMEGLAVQLARVAEQLAMAKREVMFQQRRLTSLALPTVGQPEEVTMENAAATAVARRHDSFYAAFEDVFRGSREDIIERLAPYVQRLAVAGGGQTDKPVLDIGCGRGEWLELLRRQGLSAYGIDINTIMVERVLKFGLDARHADLMTHQRSQDDPTHRAHTAFHVVEHLPFDTLIDFLDEALRILIPGGTLILETPNPETMRVGATTFYNDPTHRNPLMPAVLQFVVEHRGFSEVEVLKLHPFVQGLLNSNSEDAHLLNRVLFGPQDFGIIARRV